MSIPLSSGDQQARDQDIEEFCVHRVIITHACTHARTYAHVTTTVSHTTESKFRCLTTMTTNSGTKYKHETPLSIITHQHSTTANFGHNDVPPGKKTRSLHVYAKCDYILSTPYTYYNGSKYMYGYRMLRMFHL